MRRGSDRLRGHFGDRFDGGPQDVGEDGAAIDVGEVAGGLDGVDAEFAPLDGPADVAGELVEKTLWVREFPPTNGWTLVRSPQCPARSWTKPS